MNKMLTQICLVLSFFSLCLTVSATEKPIGNTDFQVFKAQTDAKLEALKEIKQQDLADIKKQIEIQNKTIDIFDKRISDINFYLAIYAILGMIIAIVVSLLALFTASSKAKESAENWFKDNENNLLQNIDALKERLKKYEADAKNDIAQAIQNIQIGMNENTNQLLNNILKGTNANFKIAVNTASRPSPELKAASDELKNKPESEYKFNDWNTLAFAAYDENNLVFAAEYWGKAAIAIDASNGASANALFNKGITLDLLNKYDGAIACYDELIQRYSSSTEPNLQLQVAKALVSKGVVFGKLNALDKAIACFNEVIRRFDKATSIQLQERVANALGNKGVALRSQNKHDEEIACYDEILKRFSMSSEPTLQEHIANALLNKGGLFIDKRNMPNEAIACYDQVIQRFGQSTDQTLIVVSVHALSNKASALTALDRFDEAYTIHDSLLQQFSSSTIPSLEDISNRCLNGKGFIQILRAKLAWKDEASREKYLQDALQLLSAADYTQQKNVGGFLLGNLAYCLWLLGRNAETIEPLKKALKIGGASLRDAELKDTEIHSIPLDAGFRDLINKIWLELNPQT
ncbi:MAG: tetratricopeptide repeat protein [Methylotenera sp.]